MKSKQKPVDTSESNEGQEKSDEVGSESAKSASTSESVKTLIKDRIHPGIPDDIRRRVKVTVKNHSFIIRIAVALILLMSTTRVATAATVGFARSFNILHVGLLLVAMLVSQLVIGSVQKRLDDDTDINLPDEVPEEEQGMGVIYARESSSTQVEEGVELENQIERMKNKADEMGVELWGDPITDEGISGKKFDRPGLQTLMRIATLDEIEYVFVDELDRLGRRAGPALFIIDTLEREIDVTVVTDHGEVDLDTFEGFASTVFRLVTAELENVLKSKRTASGLLETFARKDWTAVYNEAPFGYVLDDSQSGADDGAWLTKDDELEEVVQALFRVFLEADDSRAYQETKDRINSHYGELIEGELTNIKKILTNPVYIGEPTANSERLDKEETVVDEELKMVDEDLFEQVQEKIHQMKKTNTVSASRRSRALDLQRLSTLYGKAPVVESSPHVKLHCPECDTVMKRWERESLDEEKTVFEYKCANEDCEREYKKYPNLKEFYWISYYGEVDAEI